MWVHIHGVLCVCFFFSVLSKKMVREKVIPPLVDRRPLLMLGQLDQRLAEIRTCQDPTHQC